MTEPQLGLGDRGNLVAHQLHIQNDRTSMFFYGEAPWHGLGIELDSPATAAQAIEAANLNWEVVKIPLFLEDRKHRHPVPKKFGIVPKHRWGKEDCSVFGIVGSSYTPLQNREAFAFFDPIVGEGAAIYHTAGALGDGERVWILAKLPKSITVAKGDIADQYLLLSNSHDGTGSVQIKFTPIRVVCNNTLPMGLRSGPTIRVSHTRDLKERLEKARKTLALINTHYETIEAVFKAMVKIQIDEARLKLYLHLVFPDPADTEDKKALVRVERDRTVAAECFRSGLGNTVKPVAGTLWAAYNGITEFVDHRTARSGRVHLEQIWFGDGYYLKARAFEFAKKQMLAWKY